MESRIEVYGCRSCTESKGRRGEGGYVEIRRYSPQSLFTSVRWSTLVLDSGRIDLGEIHSRPSDTKDVQELRTAMVIVGQGGAGCGRASGNIAKEMGIEIGLGGYRRDRHSFLPAHRPVSYLVHSGALSQKLISDSILPHFIHSQLTPTLSLRIIDLLERLLFPLDGYPAPSPPDLTPEEAVITRKAFESRLREIIPRKSFKTLHEAHAANVRLTI